MCPFSFWREITPLFHRTAENMSMIFLEGIPATFSSDHRKYVHDLSWREIPPLFHRTPENHVHDFFGGKPPIVALKQPSFKSSLQVAWTFFYSYDKTKMIKNMTLQEVPQEVLNEYQQYANKDLRFRDMSRKAYNSRRHRFIKFGLLSPRPRHDALLKASLDKNEFLSRQRRYLKEWRRKHPAKLSDAEIAQRRVYAREWRERHPGYQKTYTDTRRKKESTTCQHCQASLESSTSNLGL